MMERVFLLVVEFLIIAFPIFLVHFHYSSYLVLSPFLALIANLLLKEHVHGDNSANRIHLIG